MQNAPISFFDLVLSSFKSLNGVLVAVILFALSTFLIIYPPQTAVGLGWVVLIGGICFMLILTLLDAGRTAFRNMARRNPAIIRVSEVVRDGRSDHICLLEPSDGFTRGIVVSIYYNDEQLERPIGIGRVTAIQSDGRIQIGEINVNPGCEALMEAFFRNNKDTLAKTTVTPTVDYPQQQTQRVSTTVLAEAEQPTVNPALPAPEPRDTDQS